MEFDALILAGGRSSRLGGVPKSQLMYDGATLLSRSLSAAAGAGAAVVVGPDPGELPAGVLSCREEPAFSGPAAAIAAGLAALERARGPLRAAMTLILACDMPKADQAVAALRAALTDHGPDPTGPDGVMSISPDGCKQPLAGLYGTAALQRSVDEMDRSGGLAGASVFALLARLDVRTVTVPAGATDDVDTWDDATALGVSRQGS
ncbi:molybdopterin-guanine dinucleotide biosynthesis protein [Arthrobacter sp. FB24]|uniref:molybdenum cofactor guanylyltransferase n=1 Tax=Arthrobacter sp. (strain FB24) TaxID=290399 RepID=UPI0000527ADD|nr:NTP transferase domain-containing protein [Arthrobacter sp. FB24]ABK02197.1 molybdopterin-guanine dinucleotide biosynthesis protein [Arthrobacter sp. FB24]